ncbi:MAG TPA: hypothetical protein VHU61_05530 [Solirubrobacteraceae bacterium]|nr:hypothetical protein [Solirubrobacteraceae bacterium]
MTLRRPASTRRGLTALAALVALLALFVASACATPASAKTPAHHAKRTKLSAAARRVAHAQSTSISSALRRSTGLKPSQVGTKGLCDTARKGHAVCNLEVLVNRRTHRLLHPHVARQHAHLTRAAKHGRGAHTAAVADTAPASATEPSFGTPAWLQQAYDTTWLSANRGIGDTVAVVDAYDDPTVASDLATYRSYFGLPACTTDNGCFTEINQDSETQADASSWPSPNSDWLMETSMDLDAVSALCPNCHIVLVEANSDSWSDLVTAEGAAANYTGVDQISDSWGVMVHGAPSPLAFGYPDVSIVASSGDTGYQLSAGPQYPSSAPNVVSAGGTSLTTGSISGYRGFTETTWTGAGSTCNTYYPKPSWQHGACNGRAAADVSADADPNTGLALYVDGQWSQAGGTSLSSPLIAAFEGLVRPGVKTGQWAYNNASVLNDITLGNNDSTSGEDLYGTCTAKLIYICRAGSGYDGPTGNGSISGEVSPGGPGIAGPDVCAANSCTSSSEGYVSATTATAANFKAAVYRNGLATSYYWQYGTSNSFGSQTPTVTAPAAAVGVAVNTVLQGLSPSTTYYYRLVATNADGSAYGFTYSFETGALPANTTAPTVTGTPTQGLALSAGVGAWTPKPTSYSYQWQRNTGSGFVNISGATAATYTPGVADLHATIDVVVTAHDAMGAKPASSAATGAVASGAPVNVAGASVTGTLRQGLALTAVVGSWSPKATSYSYQWQRDTGSGFVNIAGATAATYTPGVADLGAQIEVQVTGHNAYGTATVVGTISGTVASGAPVNTVAAKITGTLQQGHALTAAVGTWLPKASTYSYQWQRDTGSGFVNIAGATVATYTPGVADLGAQIEVQVIGHNPYGTATVVGAISGTVASDAPVNTVTAKITGTATRGATLTASVGTWSPAGTPSYVWERCAGSTCTATGAKTATYVPVVADEGDTLELVVTETNAYGQAAVTTAATATVTANPPTDSVTPTITGTAIQGDVLTAHGGTWAGAGVTLGYVWEACANGTCTPISGATATTFKLTAAQVGDTIELQVTGTNPDGNLVKTSAATGTVAA